MSYRIMYHHDLSRKKQTSWIITPAAVFLLILALINGVYFLSGNLSDLRQKLMPWTQLQVQEAYTQLRGDIADGRPIGESVEVFCREILNNDLQRTEDTD